MNFKLRSLHSSQLLLAHARNLREGQEVSDPIKNPILVNYPKKLPSHNRANSTCSISSTPQIFIYSFIYIKLYFACLVCTQGSLECVHQKCCYRFLPLCLPPESDCLLPHAWHVCWEWMNAGWETNWIPLCVFAHACATTPSLDVSLITNSTIRTPRYP